MKASLGVLVLGTLLLLPLSTAQAQAPSISPISNVTINAGATLAVNVVAVDLNSDVITLTTTLPAFATLNLPVTGTGSVVTTLSLVPLAADVGTFTGSVIATAGGEVDSTTFQITVAAAGSNQAPLVTAPAKQTVMEAMTLAFTVTATDADADVITSLTPIGLPTGATFTPNGTNTSGAFSWTPTLTQAGEYDVVFTALAGVLSGAATTHISVDNAVPLSIAEIADVSLEEGATLTVNVNVTGPASGTIDLTSSLPSFATLNPPTTSTGTGTVVTTITLSPPAGAAGSYNASVTATASGQTDVEDFVITVTPASAGEFAATASLVGNFNTHKKFICFRVQPVDESFEPQDIDLSSVMLRYDGNEITALAGKTHISWDCDDDDDNDSDSLNCEPQLRACFSMPEIRGLFGDAALPSSLVNATVNGELTTGGAFEAPIGPKFPGDNGNHGNDVSQGDHGKKGLHSKVRPNPVNPATELTFSLSQPGRVRVHVYDLQGRLVKTLLDESRPVGDQSVMWNGSDTRNGRVPSGVYYIRIKAPQGVEVQRVAVVK